MAQIIVRDVESKYPISGIQVRIESPDKSWQSLTNYQGIARFPDIRNGKYIVKVRSRDYRPHTEKHIVNRNSIITVDMQRAYD